jgi:hypothetical protein
MTDSDDALAPSKGATYREVLTRLKDVSTRLSDTVRSMGIGIVVFCWGLFTAENGIAATVVASHRKWIILTAAMAVTGLICDLLQTIVGYWVPNCLRREMEEKDREMMSYPYNSLLYRSQTFFFTAKAALTLAGAGSILLLLFLMVWNVTP